MEQPTVKCLKTLYIFCIIFTFTSCKKYVNEIGIDKIYQYYILTYDVNSNSTRIDAYLSENDYNGKLLLLNEGSTLVVNNKKMSKTGRHYTAEFTGWLDFAQITFHDSRGQEFVNTLYNEQYITNDNTNILSKSTNSTWYFGGSPINQGESVELSIVMKNNSSLDAVITSSQIGSNYLFIPYYKLSDLSLGTAVCQTKRSSKNYTGEWTSSGGMTKSVYLSEKNDMQIVN